MPTPADRSIVDRDRYLPGLPTLLNTDAVASLLARQYPGAGIADVRAAYLRYKPGQSCIAGFWVSCARGETYVYLRAVARARWPELEGERQLVRGMLEPGVLRVPELCTEINAFPNDAELSAARRLMSADLRESVLSRFARNRPAVLTSEPVVLRYKPERRLVVRAGDEDALLVKCYTKDDFARAVANASAFSRVGILALPRLKGASVSRQMLAWEWVAGSTLAAAGAGDSRQEWITMLAEGLVALHQQRTSLSARYNPCMVASDAATVTADLAFLLPDLTERLTRLSGALAGACAALEPVTASLHGDLSLDQVILGPGSRVSILDLDRAGAGHPAYDLATLAAKLRIADRPDWRVVSERLAEAYARAGGTDVSSALPTLAAGSILLQCTAPFRARQPHWPERCEQLVAEAEGLLQHARAAA